MSVLTIILLVILVLNGAATIYLVLDREDYKGQIDCKQDTIHVLQQKLLESLTHNDELQAKNEELAAEQEKLHGYFDSIIKLLEINNNLDKENNEEIKVFTAQLNRIEVTGATNKDLLCDIRNEQLQAYLNQEKEAE